MTWKRITLCYFYGNHPLSKWNWCHPSPTFACCFLSFSIHPSHSHTLFSIHLSLYLSRSIIRCLRLILSTHGLLIFICRAHSAQMNTKQSTTIYCRISSFFRFLFFFQTSLLAQRFQIIRRNKPPSSPFLMWFHFKIVFTSIKHLIGFEPIIFCPLLFGQIFIHIFLIFFRIDYHSMAMMVGMWKTEKIRIEKETTHIQ